MMQEYLVPDRRRLEPASINFWRTPARICPVPFWQKLLKESSVTADGKAVKSSF